MLALFRINPSVNRTPKSFTPRLGHVLELCPLLLQYEHCRVIFGDVPEATSDTGQSGVRLDRSKGVAFKTAIFGTPARQRRSAFREENETKKNSLGYFRYLTYVDDWVDIHRTCVYGARDDGQFIIKNAGFGGVWGRGGGWLGDEVKGVLYV